MYLINAVNLYATLICGALGCSSEETRLSSDEAFPAPAPSFTGDPTAAWFAVNSAVQPLQRSVTWHTRDGKIWVFFDKKALRSSFIDHKNIDNIIIDRMKTVPATSFYGKIGSNGRFSVRKYPKRKEAVILIVISESVRGKQTYIANLLAHEFQHVQDYLSGNAEKIMKQILGNVPVFSCARREKESARTIYYSLIMEIRAGFFELDYFLSHEKHLPKELFQFHIGGIVKTINLNMGHKNFLFAKNTLTVGGSRVKFIQLIDRVFEKAVPSKMIEYFNKKLTSYNLRIDPETKNSPAQNEKAKREHSPLQ